MERPDHVKKIQELRRSGAAGAHKNKAEKRLTKKKIIQKEQEDGNS